nr:MAG TPA: hypothetical protein [Caudoviricetes sp.]
MARVSNKVKRAHRGISAVLDAQGKKQALRRELSRSGGFVLSAILLTSAFS